MKNSSKDAWTRPTPYLHHVLYARTGCGWHALTLKKSPEQWSNFRKLDSYISGLILSCWHRDIERTISITRHSQSGSDTQLLTSHHSPPGHHVHGYPYHHIMSCSTTHTHLVVTESRLHQPRLASLSHIRHTSSL
uniref:Uncharacterized protein n=1 Tax=Setaria viridis TaxID=4556 RepID=A0A4U6TZ24_SETVI|nr:hypothetical protein SEVIR_7G222300v2 [Setaria viridis]